MDHRRGDWNALIALASNDADELSLGPAVDDRAMHEDWLELLWLWRHVDQDQHAVIRHVDGIDTQVVWWGMEVVS
jgi:hypothetical protein